MLGVMDDRQLDVAGASLLLESRASRLVGRYLRQMFDKEQPLPDLTRYSPEIFSIETRLKDCIAKIPFEEIREVDDSENSRSRSATNQDRAERDPWS